MPNECNKDGAVCHNTSQAVKPIRFDIVMSDNFGQLKCKRTSTTTTATTCSL